MKIFELQTMSNVTRCIDQQFEFKNSGILCLALIFNLSNPRTQNDSPASARKKAVQGCEI